VVPRHGDLERPPRHLLPVDLRQIRACRSLRKGGGQRSGTGHHHLYAGEVPDRLSQRRGAVGAYARGGRLADRCSRHDHLGPPRVADRRRKRHGARHRTQGTVERQLTHQGGHRQTIVARQLPRRGEDPDRDGQVIAGAVLRQIGRGKIHRDSSRGYLESAVAQRAPHPLAGLLHLASGQPDDGQRGQPEGNVHLDADGDAINAEDRRTERLGQHGQHLHAEAPMS